MDSQCIDTVASTASSQESKQQPVSVLNPTGELTLRQCNLHHVPKALLEDREELVLHIDLRDNDIQSLDCSPLFLLSQLRTLDLRNNRLEFLPAEITALQHLKVLRLDENLLSHLPTTIWDIPLEALTVGRNSLFSLPPEISRLQQLRTLIVCENRIMSLPEEIGELENLLALSIHGNEFSCVPTSLSSLLNLKELSLEWFRYTNPPLPRVLKGRIGRKLIDSLRTLCQQLIRQNVPSCSLLVFLLHFSDDNHKGGNAGKRRSLLHTAALEGDCGVLKGLIEGGLGVSALDAEGYSPLGVALREERINCAKVLLDAGAEVTTGGGPFSTPLHLSVCKREPWITRALLKRGAVVDSQDTDGCTPLHLLISSFAHSPRHSLCIANLLLKSNTAVNTRNNDGETPLHVAIRSGEIDAVRWILASNRWLKQQQKETFDLRMRTIEGRTPLHIATQCGLYEITRLLIEVGGVQVTEIDAEGLNAKQVAKKDLILGKYLTLREKEEIQKSHTRPFNITTEYSQSPRRSPAPSDVTDTERSLAERYESLYALYAERKTAAIRKAAEDLDPDSPLLPDVVYLLSQLQAEGLLPIVQSIEVEPELSQSLKSEASLAACLIREQCIRPRQPHSPIGPKLHCSEQPLRGSMRSLTLFLPLRY